MNKTIYCDECHREITDEVYYIGDNAASMATLSNTFCSEECILAYLMVDSVSVENWNG